VHGAPAARAPIPAADRAAAAAEIADRVDDVLLAALPPRATVCLYDAIGSEVPTRAIAARAIARGLALAYPRIVGDQLELALHRATPDELTPGTWRIGEPRPDAPAIAPREVALVVLPGLLFDRRGGRLGWGRGHYDATFAVAPDRPRAGLAFESQLVDRIPTDAHDLPVHLIITEAAIHRTSP
jgi:5-formyltetrahydrofolate cyclo-ligase